MLKKIKTILFLFLLIFTNSAWCGVVTYSVTSTSTISTSGTVPTGSSASYSQTYGTQKQATKGNTLTLTISGLNGYCIENITLSMKSNASSGSGKLKYSTDNGTTWIYIVGSASGGSAFNNSAWHGSWSTSYVNISKNVRIYPTASNFKIQIEATANSLYCQSYSITYSTETTNDYIFYESWNGTSSTGGNDGKWSGGIASGAIVNDNVGWTYSSQYGASECIRLGTASAKGRATTPQISYSGDKDLILTFKIGAWGGDGTLINISSTNATVSQQQVKVLNSNWMEYCVLLTDVSNNFTITWEAKNATSNRFFLDEVYIEEKNLDVALWYPDSIIFSKQYFSKIGFTPTKIEIKDKLSKTSLITTSCNNYKVNLGAGNDLSDSYCTTLKFILSDGENSLAQKVKIPHIVDDDLEAHQGAQDCDVVILPNSKLSITKNSRNRDIHIYQNAVLSIQDGKTYTVNSLTLRRDNNDVPYLSYKGTLDIKDGMFLEMRTDASDWRWMVFPDTVSISDLVSNSEVIIKHYDGQYRAEHGRNGWKTSKNNGKMAFNPGEGFIIGIDLPSETEKRIYKVRLDTSILTKEKVSKNMPRVYPYSITNKPANDLGWNVVGNPYLDTYKSNTEIGTTIRVGKLIKDPIEPWNGKWIIDEETASSELRYIIIPSDEDNADVKSAGGYKQICIKEDGYELKPFTSFFIQANTEATLMFDNENKKSRMPALYKENDNDEIFLRVNVGERKTGCFISNKFTEEYEPGDDLESLYPIYQLINNYKLLYSAINDSSIEKGVTVFSPEGNLHLDSKTDTNNFEEINAFYDGKWYDLLHGQTIDIINGSFILQAKRRTDYITTNTLETTNSGNVSKFIHNGKVYIVKNNSIYTMLGNYVQ